MVSNDGGRNFAQSNTSFTSRFTYSVTADATQPHRLYATTQNTRRAAEFVFYSSDGGRTWMQSKGLDPNRVSPFTILQDRTTPEKMLLGTNQGIYQSVDRGISWTLITPPKPPAKKTVKGSTRCEKGNCEDSCSCKACGGQTSGGQPYRCRCSGPQMIPVLSEKVKVLAFTEDGKNGILAGTDNGLYRSYDSRERMGKTSIR
jgi:hypothetical protein